METLDFRPVLLAWADVQAETLGPRKCAKKGVGAVMRKLRVHANTGLSDMYGCSARRAAQLLESKCRLCGKCVEREGVMQPLRRA